jgi:hypothetical protein
MDLNGVLMLVLVLNVYIFLLVHVRSRSHFDRGQWCQNENMAMLPRFTATNLDTCHHIWYYKTDYCKFLLGSYERDQDQHERFTDLDLWCRKSEPDLDCDLSLTLYSFIIVS